MIPLARSRNNNEHSTMQMKVGDKSMGIRVNLDTENNVEAKALYSAVKRGDMSGMSFMFTVDKDAWEDIDTDNPKRTIMSIRKVYGKQLEEERAEAALEARRMAVLDWLENYKKEVSEK